MKKISIWAKHHVLIARLIISVIHLLLTLIAFYISQNIYFNFSFFDLSIVVLILILGRIVYPFARKKSYELQKTVLFITSTCFFLIVCFAMKHNFTMFSNQNALSAVSLPSDSTNKKFNAQKLISSLAYKDYKSMSRSEKRAFRKELGKEIKAYKKIPKPHRPTAQDALLIFLIVVCGIGLLFGLSILICGISCGGIPAWAIILTLLGMGGVGIGLYFIIRKLHKNVEEERKQMKQQGKQRNEQPALFPIMT